MLLSSLILALLPPVIAKPSRCLHSGSERQINEAFAKGGKGAVVTLCPGSVHRLNESVHFTAGRQTLTTEGDPKGRERAMLIVEGEKLATAIEADCETCSYSTIQSLIIDGNRPQLLRIPKGGALIETGNGEGQTVRNCRLYEPRGWSALHFREGNRKQCKTGLVQDNEIGPCGEEWDDDYDGDMTSKPLWGFPNADGISVACAETVVERNTIFDTTDGAIVIFGSAGSEVRHNHIFSRTRVVLGGINLVDYDPFNGDFTNVQVHHNTLHALSSFIKVGIVAGPSSWSDDTETTVHGASIMDNTLIGQHFGYGIVVSSAKDFTVLRNTVDDDAVFSGVDGPRCPRAPANSPPKALLINKGSASGVFQDNFKNGEVQHIICINPPPVDGKAYKPWRLRDSPESIAAGEAAHPELAKTAFDSRLADAVVAYQMTLLGVVDNLIHRIESHQHQDPDLDDSSIEVRSGSGTGNAELDETSEDLAELENMDYAIKKGLEIVKTDFGIFVGRAKERMDINKPTIMSIYHSVSALVLAQAQQLANPPPTPEIEISNSDSGSSGSSSGNTNTGDEGLGRMTVVSVGGMLGFLGWTGARRWRAGRIGKSSKLV